MKPPPIVSFEPNDVRVGIGYDSHRLVTGRPLILGGVRIPSEKGLAGHSDADILLHALTDAILGAAGQGDIGELFPPSEPQWKGADSSIFVRHATELLYSYGWSIVNIDAVILLEEPRILPYRDRIRENVASMMGIEAMSVGLKAKTGEGIGPVGTGELAVAHAVALIKGSGTKQLM